MYECSFKPNHFDVLFSKLVTGCVYWSAETEEIHVPLNVTLKLLGNSFSQNKIWLPLVEITPNVVILPPTIPTAFPLYNNSKFIVEYEVDTVPLSRINFNYKFDIFTCINPKSTLQPFTSRNVLFKFQPITEEEYEEGVVAVEAFQRKGVLQPKESHSVVIRIQSFDQPCILNLQMVCKLLDHSEHIRHMESVHEFEKKQKELEGQFTITENDICIPVFIHNSDEIIINTSL
ncbi:hypothetical protein RI129_006600 [Pyrocoelia pectoralis]|uniref:CFAP65 tenth Ig-like domain-containing protein n=1 Tax=Pyrocoelia pectoralis TaxID=417401 RepID=A0AAN7VBJ7_9COLE